VIVGPTFFSSPAGDIEFVAAVYTAATGDDTPEQLELPAHNPGDFIIVCARGTSAPGIGKLRDAFSTDLITFTSIDQWSPSFGNGVHLMWCMAPAGAYEFYGAAGTAQVGVYIYRGPTDVGEAARVSDILDNFGGEIPALTMEDTSGKAWVWGGVIWNQLKASVTDPAGLTRRTTSPSALGGGTGVVFDTAGGVASFGDTYVTAAGAAYYSAFAVELKP
jgi:hypothetical protein